MEKTFKISKEVMTEAAKLSHEWGNTSFFHLDEKGSIVTTVFNHFKWLDPQPKYFAYVNGNDGWIITNTRYEFEVSPDEIKF